MAKKLPEIDPLSFLPLRYEDRRTPVTSGKFVDGEKTLACGKPENIIKGEKITTVAMRDQDGVFFVKLLHFGKYQSYIFSPKNNDVYIYGTAQLETNGMWSFFHPEIPDEINKIVPIYKVSKGISKKRMREHVLKTAEALAESLEDEVPPEVLKARGLPSIKDAIMQIHNPRSMPDDKPLYRIAYREIWEMKQKLERIPKQDAPVIEADMKPFVKMLPFKLTGDQVNVIRQILTDMKSGKGMRRLLVADVAAGKTAVAMAATYACYMAGYRVLVLSPTIVLAGQTYDKFVEIFGKENVSLTTGQIKDNPSMICVGTHALLSKYYAGIGMVIVDEQHKFGVRQRTALLGRGDVHALQLSATLIPRSFAMLLQGAMDVSMIKEMPFKKDIETKVVPKEHTQKILDHMKQVIKNGGKALVIYPRVENDKGEYRAVENVKSVWEKIFPGEVLFVHGRQEDKLDITNDFRKNPYKKVLVATSLIETGIDVPEATMLVVSGAEMFGISSLHQLRGRIGRRGDKAYCYLMYKKEEAEAKLKPLETLNDGFAISELDADSRGYGDMFGRAQTGNFFKLGNMHYYKTVIPMVEEDLQGAKQEVEK